MQRGVYAAATAMSTAQQWLDVVSNNLANASTVAYKKVGLTFNDGFVRELAANGGGGDRIGSMGSGSIVQSQYNDFSVGMIAATGNPLDMALSEKDTAFAVQTPAGIRYTRNGQFQLSSDRQLTDGSGNKVLDNQGNPITLPQGKIVVSDKGAISVDQKPIAEVGVYTGTFNVEGGNLYDSNDAKVSDQPRIVAGSLESSNVNTIEEMISMIRINRAFELAQRSVQSQDDNTQKLISSLQGR